MNLRVFAVTDSLNTETTTEIMFNHNAGILAVFEEITFNNPSLLSAFDIVLYNMRTEKLFKMSVIRKRSVPPQVPPLASEYFNTGDILLVAGTQKDEELVIPSVETTCTRQYVSHPCVQTAFLVDNNRVCHACGILCCQSAPPCDAVVSNVPFMCACSSIQMCQLQLPTRKPTQNLALVTAFEECLKKSLDLPSRYLLSTMTTRCIKQIENYSSRVVTAYQNGFTARQAEMLGIDKIPKNREKNMKWLMAFFSGRFIHPISDECEKCGSLVDMSTLSADTPIFHIARATCKSCKHMQKHPILSGGKASGFNVSVAFALFLTSLSMEYETRIVAELCSDTVWVEWYNHDTSKWVHVDILHDQLDKPMWYETVRGLNMAYCISFTPFDVVDVTLRYTSSPEVFRRRHWCSEYYISQYLIEKSGSLQKGLPSEFKRTLMYRRGGETLCSLVASWKLLHAMQDGGPKKPKVKKIVKKKLPPPDDVSDDFLKRVSVEGPLSVETRASSPPKTLAIKEYPPRPETRQRGTNKEVPAFASKDYIHSSWNLTPHAPDKPSPSQPTHPSISLAYPYLDKLLVIAGRTVYSLQTRPSFSWNPTRDCERPVIDSRGHIWSLGLMKNTRLKLTKCTVPSDADESQNLYLNLRPGTVVDARCCTLAYYQNHAIFATVDGTYLVFGICKNGNPGEMNIIRTEGALHFRPVLTVKNNELLCRVLTSTGLMTYVMSVANEVISITNVQTTALAVQGTIGCSGDSSTFVSVHEDRIVWLSTDDNGKVLTNTTQFSHVGTLLDVTLDRDYLICLFEQPCRLVIYRASSFSYVTAIEAPRGGRYIFVDHMAGSVRPDIMGRSSFSGVEKAPPISRHVTMPHRFDSYAPITPSRIHTQRKAQTRFMMASADAPSL